MVAGITTNMDITSEVKKKIVAEICMTFNVQYSERYNAANQAIYRIDSGLKIFEYFSLDELLIDWLGTIVGNDEDGAWDKEIVIINKIKYCTKTCCNRKAS